MEYEQVSLARPERQEARARISNRAGEEGSAA